MSHNNPKVLDRYQMTLAKRNAYSVDRLRSNEDLVKNGPTPPFLGKPAWYGSGFRFRDAYRKHHSKFPNPVPPSQQHNANVRRMRQMKASRDIDGSVNPNQIGSWA